MTDLALSVRQVGVQYRRLGFLRRRAMGPPALKDVSFEVRAGETLGIVGRNGVGKSTLLKVLAGVIWPDRGEMVNHGVTVSLLTLNLGFQDELSGRENALLGGMLLGLSLRESKARLPRVLEFSDLRESFDRALGTYSSGMRARLGFSIALSAEADVLLIDEILSVGDAAFQQKSADALHELMRSERTVVLVSHSMRHIEELCDRALWLDRGTVVASGHPTEITREYIDDVGGAKPVSGAQSGSTAVGNPASL